MNAHAQAEEEKLVEFDGRVAIITGGASGIGNATAELMGQRGARIVIADMENAEAAAAELVAKGIEAAGVACNVTSDADCDAVVGTAVEKYGTVDVLVNNAAQGGKSQLFEDEEDEVFQRVMNINFFGAHRLANKTWSIMKRQESGNIVNILSSSGMFGEAKNGAYAYAKTALYGRRGCWPSRESPFGIKVNGVCPIAMTPWAERAMARRNNPELADLIRRTMPANKVSPLITFLADADCPLTGHVLSAFGGRVARHFVAANTGYFDFDLTPEKIYENLDTITSVEEFLVPKSANEEMELLEKAKRKAQE
jgi:NAD(P)-dependent dehydrogenase (short-subunit alcohol dehydrogenase family)